MDVHIGDDLLEGSPELSLLVGIKEFLSAEHFGQVVTAPCKSTANKNAILYGMAIFEVIQQPTQKQAEEIYFGLG